MDWIIDQGRPGSTDRTLDRIGAHLRRHTAPEADVATALERVRGAMRDLPPSAEDALLRVHLETGRTHQIRVHLADAGHVVVGDPKYGDFALNKALARGTALPGTRFERMFLHAKRLSFVHPASGEPVVLEAALPEACARLLSLQTPVHDAVA